MSKLKETLDELQAARDLMSDLRAEAWALRKERIHMTAKVESARRDLDNGLITQAIEKLKEALGE
jgi:hypothetical protein